MLLRGPGTHCRVRQGSHPPGPSPGLPLLNPLHWEWAPDQGWQKLNGTTASGGPAGAGGRGAGRAQLNPEPPLREGKACPLHCCPGHPCWAGAAEVRESRGGERVQAQTIRDSARAGARPDSRATLPHRRAAPVLVIKYGRAGGWGHRRSWTHTGLGCLHPNW